MNERLLSIDEACMRLNYESLFGHDYVPHTESARACADGYVYVAGPVRPDFDVHVKVGSASNPLSRIRDFNCASPSLYTGTFFLVRDCRFWEATALNILKPFRVSRYYGASEIVNGREFINNIEDVIRTWEPDPDSLAWIYHLYYAVCIRAGFPRMTHDFMDILSLYAPNCPAEPFYRRVLELFHRKYEVLTKEQVQSEGTKQYDGHIVYDRVSQ